MGLYTQEEQNKLDAYKTAYDQAAADYNNQKAIYDRGVLALSQPINPLYGKYNLGSAIGVPEWWVTQAEGQQWLSSVKANENSSKSAMETAGSNYNNYLQSLTTKYSQQFALENPQAALQMQQTAAQANLDLTKAAFMQKNTKYLIIGGIVIVVIVIGFFVYKKVVK